MKFSSVISIVTRTVVAIVVIVVATFIAKGLFSSRPQPAPSDTAGDLPIVVVVEAAPVTVQRRWDGFGTARAMDSADVPARVQATVDEIPAEILEGAAVRAGDVLVRLDATDFESQVEVLEQNIADLTAQMERLDIEMESQQQRLKLAGESVALSQAEFDRVSTAFERGVAKQREVDQARQSLVTARQTRVSTEEQLNILQPRRNSLAALKQAQEASKRLAEENVRRSVIRAPIDGVLQSVDVEIGENVGVGQRVARVVDLTKIEAPLRVPAGARSEISVGDSVELRSTGAVETTWTGEVSRVAPEDDAQDRTMTIYVVLEQQPGDGVPLLAPGRFVRGQVVSGRTQQRWVVPRRSVQSGRVQTVEDGLIASRPIEVDFHIEKKFAAFGIPDREWVVLKGELPIGTLVVVDASRSLAVGLPVEPRLAGASSSELVNGSEPKS